MQTLVSVGVVVESQLGFEGKGAELTLERTLSGVRPEIML